MAGIEVKDELQHSGMLLKEDFEKVQKINQVYLDFTPQGRAGSVNYPAILQKISKNGKSKGVIYSYFVGSKSFALNANSKKWKALPEATRKVVGDAAKELGFNINAGGAFAQPDGEQKVASDRMTVNRFLAATAYEFALFCAINGSNFGSPVEDCPFPSFLRFPGFTALIPRAEIEVYQICLGYIFEASQFLNAGSDVKKRTVGALRTAMAAFQSDLTNDHQRAVIWETACKQSKGLAGALFSNKRASFRGIPMSDEATDGHKGVLINYAEQGRLIEANAKAGRQVDRLHIGDLFRS